MRCAMWCSAPDAGRELPIICMAIPLNKSAFVTFSNASGSPRRMPSTLSTAASAAVCIKSWISGQKYSPVITCAIRQSASAVYLARISPTPLRTSSMGAAWRTSVSAATISGATAGNVFLYPCHVIAATVLQKPSTLAAVGQETKRSPRSCAQ